MIIDFTINLHDFSVFVEILSLVTLLNQF